MKCNFHFYQMQNSRKTQYNFYSILFYNSEVWHLPTLHQSLKNNLLSISAKAIKICAKSKDTWMLSFGSPHEMAGRLTS